jgi:VanZ family protein
MNGKVTAVLRMVPMSLTMGTIFFLSHQPGDEMLLPPLPGLDKWAHLVAYGVLAATVLFAFSDRQKNTRPRQVLFFTVVFCLLFGISDEFHQSFIPGRTSSVYDLIADGGGAAMVCALWGKWRHKITTNKILRSH